MIVQLNHIWNLETLTAEMAKRGETAPLDVLAAVRMKPLKSFELRAQIRAIRSVSDDIEAERVNLVQRLGKETRNEAGEVTGHTIPNNSPAWKQFITEVETLCAGTVEIPGDQLSLEDLGEADISAAALEALAFMFVEATPKPAKKAGKAKKATA